jgi:hypothetical protein
MMERDLEEGISRWALGGVWAGVEKVGLKYRCTRNFFRLRSVRSYGVRRA